MEPSLDRDIHPNPIVAMIDRLEQSPAVWALVSLLITAFIIGGYFALSFYARQKEMTFGSH